MTNCTVKHDDAGNLIDDCHFRYVYDAWHRLVKVQASVDGGAATFQTAEFDAQDRRIKKTVTLSGSYDGTVVYLYDGQKIVETRDGSDNLYQQVIHGTQYIAPRVRLTHENPQPPHRQVAVFGLSKGSIRSQGLRFISSTTIQPRTLTHYVLYSILFS